jgi:hypothetical protein
MSDASEDSAEMRGLTFAAPCCILSLLVEVTDERSFHYISV